MLAVGGDRHRGEREGTGCQRWGERGLESIYVMGVHVCDGRAWLSKAVKAHPLKVRLGAHLVSQIAALVAGVEERMASILQSRYSSQRLAAVG